MKSGHVSMTRTLYLLFESGAILPELVRIIILAVDLEVVEENFVPVAADVSGGQRRRRWWWWHACWGRYIVIWIWGPITESSQFCIEQTSEVYGCRIGAVIEVDVEGDREIGVIEVVCGCTWVYLSRHARKVACGIPPPERK